MWIKVGKGDLLNSDYIAEILIMPMGGNDNKSYLVVASTIWAKTIQKILYESPKYSECQLYLEELTKKLNKGKRYKFINQGYIDKVIKRYEDKNRGKGK
jgi:hypothetical protein